jgi:hypothetical protein
VGNQAKQSSALSRLFSSTVFRQLATKGRSDAFARLIDEADLISGAGKSTLVRDLFETAFDKLKQRTVRDEYIYKAALTHRVLLGKHSLRTACMMSEFRTGECKADIAILNGTTTVFEIKSERDSLSRLERQIASYRKVFASVFVIAGENHIDAVLDAVPGDVGVMSLDHRHYISTRREATNDPERISPQAVFDALRTSELKTILESFDVRLENIPNIRLRDEMRQYFLRLSAMQVHDGMLRTLKRSRDLLPLEQLIERLPNSLHAAALSVPLRKIDHDRLVAAVDTPMQQALSWA